MGNVLTKVVLTAKEELDKAINKLSSIADDNKKLIEENKVAKQTDLDKLSSQMDEKANIQEVFLKNDGININDFDESTRRTFLEAQGIDVNYVLGEKNVLTDNLGDNIVTGNKLGIGTLRLIGGSIKDVDIFQNLTIEDGKYVSWTNGIINNNEFFFASSDYIDVIPNTIVKSSYGIKGAFYDESKKFVSGIDGDADKANQEIAVPSNAYYMRISSKKANIENFSVIIKKSETSSKNYKIPSNLDGKTLELEDDFIKTNYLADNSVTRDKCDDTIVKYKRGKNLFNPNTITSDYFVDWTTGNLVTNTSYISSDFIEIEPGKVINQTFNTHNAFYTRDKVFICGYRSYETPNLIIAPDDAKYIRVSFDKGKMNDDYMLVSNQDLGDFEEYGYTVDNIINGKEIYFPSKYSESEKYKNSRLYGKKVSWYGTSITQGYDWCNLVNKRFNFNATNNGVGGTTVCKENENSSMCTQNRMLGKYSNVTDSNTGEITLSGVPIPSDVEVIFIEGGTNDWARNWIIGDKEFTETPNGQTFAGACHLMFKNMTELFPNAEIIVVGSPFGKLANRNVFDNKYGLLNNNNLQTVDYGDILLDIAGKWGIKGFNMGREMQVHDNNIATLIPDGLHLTTTEVQEKASNAIINYLLSLN